MLALQRRAIAFPCMQGFVDRLAAIASAGSLGVEPGTFVKAFDKAAADKHRIVFVGHSLG